MRGLSVLLAKRLIRDIEAKIEQRPAAEISVDKLVGDIYGGRVSGQITLKERKAGKPEYSLQAGFNEVDLSELLAAGRNDGLEENEHTAGTLEGSLSVSGTVGDVQSRSGRLRLRILDMKVGRLSPLAKVLYVLKLTDPGDFAFNRMLVDGYIKGQRLLLSKVDISGKGLAFYGGGWVDLAAQDVDMQLIARGSRLATAEPSIFQSLAEGLGGAVVRIDVTGDLEDPEVETKALPVIEESLEILGAEPDEP
jgi:uncharacterized protein involved in outer membrane biogenesis